MNILITGISGFVGRFLTHELVQAGHTVSGLDQSASNATKEARHIHVAGITDSAAVIAAVNEMRPDACIHLAGIASPPIGKRYPELMLNTNILGTAVILDALRAHAPACRFLLASTAYVYGNPNGDAPITEDSPLRPNGIYAVSKVAADLMTLAYAQDYNMHTMTARAANHTGPGQNTDFVVPTFAAQVVRIAQGHAEPVMHVGNLDSERSFLDVRDVVRAYRLLIESGKPGSAYNVAPADRVRIGWILETLAEMAGISPRIEVDPQRYRPTDKTPLLDTRAITRDTGWNPTLALSGTLKAMIAAAGC